RIRVYQFAHWKKSRKTLNFLEQSESSMITVEVHATSHVGRVRKGNEDKYLLLNISGSKVWTSSQDDGEFVIESQEFEIDNDGVVVAVSDGMGGALAGEVA